MTNLEITETIKETQLHLKAVLFGKDASEVTQNKLRDLIDSVGQVGKVALEGNGG